MTLGGDEPLTVVDLRHDSVKRTSTMTLAAPAVERFCVYIRRKLRKIVRISKEKCNQKV